MSQHYSDPEREEDALPDVKVFYHARCEPDGECAGPGWYWWSCFPGCTPADPIGPFKTEAEALANAQDEATS